MAKFYGKIGYAVSTEINPGVWQEVITEKPYYGDVVKYNRRLENGDHLNNDISISNTLSIVADEYANGNIMAMRYVTWMGAKWKITNVEVQRPRLILTIGGVWNG